MEIKEGMYVRYIRSFKDNIQEKPVVEIDKVRRVDERNINLENWHESWIYPLNDFVKMLTKDPSFEVINILEVGDYVNGDLVLFTGATTWDNDGNVLLKQVHINHNGYDWWLTEDLIKSIVTKEQFESMSYKVGEV